MRAWLVVLIWAVAAGQVPSEPEEGTRALWDSTFLRKRPAAQRAAAQVPAASKAPVAAAIQAGDGLGDGFVGVTLWRLRRSQAGDEQGIRLLVYEDRRDQEWTPERVELDTPLVEGQRVRIGIESARSGYLYVIDREQYQDGSLGDPYLLFPVLRARGGNNRVQAGTLAEIPGWEDKPPYLKLVRARPDHVAEVLTVLVTPEPIAGLTIGEDPLKLTGQQVEGWQKRWGAQVKRLEARAQVGRVYTTAEREAGRNAASLTPDDPAPQTLYQVEARSGEPLLVTVALRIGR